MQFIIKKYKHVFFFILFTVTASSLFSQSIQELEEKLKSASQEEKPQILNQLSEAALKSNPDKSIDYAEQALKAAKKVDDVNEQAGAYVNLGNGYEVQGNLKKAVSYYKDAVAIFDKYGQKESSGYLWNRIADWYIKNNKYEEALDANNKALDYFKQSGNKKEAANMRLEIGDIYFKQGKFEAAINEYKFSQKSYENSKDGKGLVTSLNRIGTAYAQWGNFDESFLFLNQAYDAAKKYKMNSEAETISINIEKVKKNLSNYQKSQTDYAVQQEKEKQLQIQSLTQQNMQSMEEIEKLSFENQVKVLKIKGQQEELKTKQLEADNKAKENKLLKQEKDLKDAELNKQKIIIWGGIGLSLLGLIMTFVIFIAYRNKKKANTILSQKNEIIYKQKKQIEQKNTLITDSIDYAKNIQDAILPPPNSLAKYFSDSFILYKPKDIVSGDFYWTHEENNYIYIAAADCTGHGVPGAFMSLLGFIMLDDAVKRNTHWNPAEILAEVNTQLMAVLHQTNQNTSTGKFGMDIALIKYEKDTHEVIYSGAHNPLITISNNQISECKADKISIGSTNECKFTNHSIKLNTGDRVYLFSDGFQDQIGGDKKKKFLAFHLRELLLEVHKLDMPKQMEEIEKKHLEWRGKAEQTDDILVIGITI